MKKSLLSLLALVACGVEPTASKTMEGPVPYDANDFQMLGMGFNSLTGKTRQQCVVSLKNDPDRIGEIIKGMPQDGSASATFKLEAIESSKDFIKSLSGSGSVSYGVQGGNSASGKVSFANSLEINNYSVYALASVKVEKPAFIIPTPRLSAYAEKLYSKPDKTQFFKECGDEYIAGLKKGGEYYAVLEIKTRSQNEKQQIKTELSGQYGVFKATADASEDLSKLFKDKEIRITAFQAGGALRERLVGISLEQFIEQAVSFASTVNDDNAAVYEVITANYERIPEKPEGVDAFFLSEQRNVIEELASTLYDLRSMESDIKYIINNQNQFNDVSIDSLNDAQAKVIAGMNATRDAIAQCQANAMNCKRADITWPTMPNVVLPKRKSGALQRHEKCGVELYKEDRTDKCEVAAWRVDTGAVCGVARWAVGRSEACGAESYNSGIHESCGVGSPRRISVLVQRCDTSRGGCSSFDSWDLDGTYAKLKQETPGRLGPMIQRTLHTYGVVKHYDYYPFLSCPHPSFGVAQWNQCEHPNHGAGQYHTCAHESFGALDYKMCRHKDHGVELYKECEVD